MERFFAGVRSEGEGVSSPPEGSAGDGTAAHGRERSGSNSGRRASRADVHASAASQSRH